MKYHPSSLQLCKKDLSRIFRLTAEQAAHLKIQFSHFVRFSLVKDTHCQSKASADTVSHSTAPGLC